MQRFAIVIASLIISFVMMALMIGWLGTAPADSTLLVLCAVPCVVVLGWGAIGAPQFAQIWIVPVMIPSMMAGMGLLFGVSERYPALSPMALGAMLAVAFMVLGVLVTWMVIHLHRDGRAGQGSEIVGRIVVAGMVFLFAGVLFFQPLVLLVNAQAQPRPPLVAPGTIVNLYVTHGKHTSYFVDFSGPAANWSNTMTHGEFEIEGKAYDALHIGDRPCVTIHTGLLGLRWWTIDDCGRGAKLATILHVWENGDHAAVIAGLEALANSDAPALGALTPQWIAEAQRTLAMAHDLDLTRRLLALLASPAYVPSDPDQSTDPYRYGLAVMQMASGDEAGAGATLARLDNPFWQMQATIDPRLRGAMPAEFDARAEVERAIARQQAALAQNPEALGSMVRLADLYLMLDNGQAMVDVLEKAKYRVNYPETPATPRERYQWWFDLAQGYLLMGRYDDALHTWRASMASGKVNEKNQAVLLDVAATQIDFGHAADALGTLASLDPRPDNWNDQQEAFWHRHHACALSQAGKGDAGAADLAWLHDHGAVAPGVLFGALACMHHDDEAAALLIRQIENPASSASVRLQLASFAPFPASYPGPEVQRGLARLKTRLDVVAATARAGGTGTFNIPAP